MKLLNICIPTYNRPKQLSTLYTTFLSRVINAYEADVDVIICDNSGPEIAAVNRSIFPPGVKYYRNETNIGFAGNLARCLREADGEYVWLLSDDDLVLWDGFLAIINALRAGGASGVDCFMLPFYSKSPYGDVVYSNRAADWRLDVETTTFQLVSTNQCPFILFSSAVMRLDKSVVDKLQAKYVKNSYVQTILFLMMLRSDSKIRFLSTPVLDYQQCYSLGFAQFAVAEMADSLQQLREYTVEHFDAKPDYDSDYRGWLLWVIHHRGGLYNMHEADAARWLLLPKLLQHLSVKALLLAIGVLLPKIVMRPVYLVYKTLTDARVYGCSGIRDLLRRYVVYRRFIHDLNKV